MGQIILGDYLEELKKLDKGSIDLIATDLPYNVTHNIWDSTPLDLEKMWPEVRRVLKPKGIFLTTAAQPFTTRLISSNPNDFKYTMVWEKTTPTGNLNAKRRPLTAHEDIVIFYRKPGGTYNPQKTTGHERKVVTTSHKRNTRQSSNYGTQVNTHEGYDSTERHPTSILRFKSDKQLLNLHPTQKPLAMYEWFLLSYSNEGDTVLDFCCGSGTTGLAAVRTGREYILIDNDPKCIQNAQDRCSGKIPVAQARPRKPKKIKLPPGYVQANLFGE